MNERHRRQATFVALGLLLTAAPGFAQESPDGTEPETREPQKIPGEVIDPALHGPAIVESMADVAERERRRPEEPLFIERQRNGAQGYWEIPTRKHTHFPHSGEHYATNAWGDTNMGIGFGEPVDLVGTWVSGQELEPRSWTSGLQVVGFRDGEEVARTEWFEEISHVPAWFEIGMTGVDRVEFVARPMIGGSGYYGIDDLTFVRPASAPEAEATEVVLAFDELGYRNKLTGSDYGGLEWEAGTGDFSQENVEVVHPPQVPPGWEERFDSDPTPGPESGGNATLPVLGTNFVGPRLADPGAGWLPPDTCGAVGTDHFISVVNQHISVYDKASGTRLLSSSLQSFFNTGGSSGDPRVVFDHFSNRWIVIAGDFNNGVRFAISLTDNAMGTWYKTFVTFSAGADANKWPDYPTLGVDSAGIYMAAYMVGGSNQMSIFAVDKAPLLQANPTLGTVSAWRSLAWEGAIQPCVTYGNPGAEYFVSRNSSSRLRLRKVEGPLNAPTLTNLGFVTTPTGNSPPSVPALGSNTNLSTVGARPMNAVFRNGSVWTANTIARQGRAASRWYELDPLTMTLPQVGTVEDSTFHYFFPAIAVNAAGDVALGFTGSHAGIYPGAYYTGRFATDTPSQMAPPASFKDGAGAYNQGGGNPQRWGDYSLTSVDPDDDTSMWTIQEYSRLNGSWGTWIAKLEYPGSCPPVASYCSTSPNSVGPGAIIGHTGTTSVSANDLGLWASPLPPNQNGIFYYGPEQVQLPFGEGFRCVGAGATGTIRLDILLADSFGLAQYALDNTNPPSASGQISVGQTWFFQYWYRDPAGGGSNFNLSDALEATFCP